MLAWRSASSRVRPARDRPVERVRRLARGGRRASATHHRGSAGDCGEALRRSQTRASGRRPALRLLIHGVEIRGGADSHQVRAELHDVRWDGWPLETVRVAAHEVRLSTFPQGQVAASGVRVDGRTSLWAAVACLDGQAPLCPRRRPRRGATRGARRHRSERGGGCPRPPPAGRGVRGRLAEPAAVATVGAAVATYGAAAGSARRSHGRVRPS